MKTRLKIVALTTFSFFALFSYTSCVRNKCNTTVCANGGTCNGGVCTCPVGYEGSNCQDTSRNKFLGNWSVSEQGSVTEASHYPLSILPGENINQVVIINFYNYFSVPVNATVDVDTLSIPNQQYQGKVLFGKGYTFNSSVYGLYGEIVMAYEIVDTATQVVNDFGFNYTVDHSNASVWTR